MSEHTRNRRDFIQNITIAVLCVSAVLLFAQTQIYNLGANTGLAAFLSGGDLTSGTAVSEPTNPLLTGPVRIAASSAFGRYGSVTLSTGDETFEPLRGLLEQALSSIDDPSVSSQEDFFAALETTSVYYDFLSSLPLSVLAELVRSSEIPEQAISARYLLLSGREGGVDLYLWDGSRNCYCCTTSLTLESLEQIVNQYELGNAYFAFESADINAQSAAPQSLFLEEMPSLPQLSISVPLSDTDRLLTALDFNPNTQYRYVDAGGTEVVREGDRTLRIYTDGTLSYSGGTVSAEEAPSLSEAISTVNSLLHSLLPSDCGAELYLDSVWQAGVNTVLHFGYQVGGIPVRFADGTSAAEITLVGQDISDLTLHVRQYTTEETSSLLLPLRQALAIHASTQEGAELFIGYPDNGIGTVSAGWLAEQL